MAKSGMWSSGCIIPRVPLSRAGLWLARNDGMDPDFIVP